MAGQGPPDTAAGDVYAELHERGKRWVMSQDLAEARRQVRELRALAAADGLRITARATHQHNRYEYTVWLVDADGRITATGDLVPPRGSRSTSPYVALGAAARAELRDAGIPIASYARWLSGGEPTWHGDTCGCPDDRCIGYHHGVKEECGCLPVQIARYHEEHRA